jgi:hypothetical protein
MNFKKQMAITQKITSAEYRFLCTAPLFNENYHPIRFQVQRFYSLREMARMKLTKGNKSKIKKCRVMILVHCIFGH